MSMSIAHRNRIVGDAYTETLFVFRIWWKWIIPTGINWILRFNGNNFSDGSLDEGGWGLQTPKWVKRGRFEEGLKWELIKAELKYRVSWMEIVLGTIIKIAMILNSLDPRQLHDLYIVFRTLSHCRLCNKRITIFVSL